MFLRVKSLEECKKIDNSLHGIDESSFIEELLGVDFHQGNYSKRHDSYVVKNWLVPMEFCEELLEDKEVKKSKEENKVEMILLDIRDLLIEIKEKLK